MTCSQSGSVWVATEIHRFGEQREAVLRRSNDGDTGRPAGQDLAPPVVPRDLEHGGYQGRRLCQTQAFVDVHSHHASVGGVRVG